MSTLNYPHMPELQDIIQFIPDVDQGMKENIEALIRTAYWRGVHHYKDDPEGTKNRLEKYISSL